MSWMDLNTLTSQFLTETWIVAVVITVIVTGIFALDHILTSPRAGLIYHFASLMILPGIGALVFLVTQKQNNYKPGFVYVNAQRPSIFS